MEGRELTIVNIEEYAMTADRVVNQTKLIQQVMQAVMKKDEHYGVIPGCEKPSLYKPGAEKLSVTFRLVPSYKIETKELANGHREEKITCTLTHAPTGQFFGEGVGSCTTMESKYRYRNAEPELTSQPVPGKYWQLKKANRLDEAQVLIGGKGYTTRKDPDGNWKIAKKSGGKVEHDNPADYYNTILKMAKKRAHVDAVLTATAASDIFTQDVEDLAENGHFEAPKGQATKKGKPAPEEKPFSLQEWEKEHNFSHEEIIAWMKELGGEEKIALRVAAHPQDAANNFSEWFKAKGDAAASGQL